MIFYTYLLTKMGGFPDPGLKVLFNIVFHAKNCSSVLNHFAFEHEYQCTLIYVHGYKYISISCLDITEIIKIEKIN